MVLMQVWFYFKFIYFDIDFFYSLQATASPDQDDTPNLWIIKENFGDQHSVINNSDVFIYVYGIDIDKLAL